MVLMQYSHKTKFSLSIINIINIIKDTANYCGSTYINNIYTKIVQKVEITRF